MITLIPDLPPGVVGARLSGVVTAEEYGTVLEPALDAAAAERDTVDVVGIVEPGFERFTLGAMVQDGIAGLRERHHWGRIALVSDDDKLSGAVRTFAAMAGMTVHTYPRFDEAVAIAWVSRTPETGDDA